MVHRRPRDYGCQDLAGCSEHDQSAEQGAASGECNQDARNGTQGRAAARGQFALFDKGRALEAIVAEARSWEQGARSGRRDSAALSA